MKTTLIKSISASLILLGLVGALGYASVSYLKKDARLIVEDSMPSLALAASASSNLATGYNNLLLFLTTKVPDERKSYVRMMNETSEETQGCLEHYATLIRGDGKDQAIFDNLTKVRENYLKIRSEVIALADEGKDSQALRLFHDSLRPAYEKYHQAGEKLLSYNIETGAAFGREITTICNVTQILVAFVGILLFVAGFLFGFSR